MDKVDDFLDIFNASKSRIRHFPGVHSLELLRDFKSPNVFYTLSLWESQEALDAYRHSELFGSVWPRTKALFAGPPQAFSLVSEMVVD